MERIGNPRRTRVSAVPETASRRRRRELFVPADRFAPQLAKCALWMNAADVGIHVPTRQSHVREAANQVVAGRLATENSRPSHPLFHVVRLVKI